MKHAGTFIPKAVLAPFSSKILQEKVVQNVHQVLQFRNCPRYSLWIFFTGKNLPIQQTYH